MSNKFVLTSALLPFVGGFTAPHLFLNSRTVQASESNFSFRLATKRSGGKGNSGKGFGKGSEEGSDVSDTGAVEKTYGESARAPIKDLIDSEAAMAAFFDANEDWAPLFRSIASHGSVPAMSFLGGQHGGDVEFEDTSPWQKLDAIPSGEEKMAVVSSFLDSMQRSLVDIPVVEGKEEDEHDLHFIEEGRRILTISRFHVLPGVTSGEIHHHEELFRTCWSELLELRSADEADTGSLILLPDYELSDLRRFTDMNLQRPLDWLGMSDLFEVASLKRESPAIRLIHKLSDIPDLGEKK